MVLNVRYMTYQPMLALRCQSPHCVANASAPVHARSDTVLHARRAMYPHDSRVEHAQNRRPLRVSTRVCCADSGASSSKHRRGDDPVHIAGDWRAFRARLVAEEHDNGAVTSLRPADARGDRWAHLLTEPEKGCLLVARRSDMRFFNNTVVFLAWHGALLNIYCFYSFQRFDHRQQRTPMEASDSCSIAPPP